MWAIMLTLRPEQQQHIIQYMMLLLSIIPHTMSSATEAACLPSSRKEPEPYHTSILSGEGWVLELLTGHPECICNELRVHADVFNHLILTLRSYSHSNSRFVLLEEQLAIFLYTCVMGLPVRHIGERSQQANDMISWCIVQYV